MTEVKKFRKKPVVIEAFQYDGDMQTSTGWYVPEWAKEAYERGILFYQDHEGVPAELFVKTLEGSLHVSVGDYVIQGVQGELYPCKPDIFVQTYEEVQEQ